MPAKDKVNGVENFATWADLCEPPKPKTIDYNGKDIKYLPWIPADEMAEIQRKATARGKRGGGVRMDIRAYQMMVLKKVLIEPRIKTEDDERMAAKMDSRISLGILNDVLDQSTFDEMVEALGETPRSRPHELSR